MLRQPPAAAPAPPQALRPPVPARESIAPASVAAAPVPSAPAATVAAKDTAQLETFLINFVVEQTGYPPEVVDLDADLEADLGIDSIKKAQLFGELNEHFDIGSSAAVTNLSLDDFPTLRHVLNFLASQAPSAGNTPAASSPPVPAAATHLRPSRPRPLGLHSQRRLGPGTAIVPPAAAPGGAELETFLINFVVEQTGYPPEVVELEADLEADLGIDSIKKAQLFGELNEHFDMGSSAAVTNLSLDDFPTLRHVLNFLAAPVP